MKQLGNLAIICAKRPDVMMVVYDGRVTVHVGAGPDRASLHSTCDSDAEINRIIHELNFGKFAEKKSV